MLRCNLKEPVIRNLYRIKFNIFKQVAVKLEMTKL
jgi:hypothetical protein